MLVLSMISWWYTAGWLKVMAAMWHRVQATLGFFSVGQLAGSLFAPFRQISADHVQGSITAQLQAWGDRLFSRFMGAIIRLLLIFFGLLTALVMLIIGALVIIAWPLLPLAPIFGGALTLMGYMP